MNDVLDNMVEVLLPEQDNFLKVKETLTRIGIPSRKERRLNQSCHILHKRGHYYIVHFKEMFLLDGKPADFTEDDIARRNSIVNLLAEWGLITLVDKNKSAAPVAPLTQIKILKHSEKDDWELVTKYSIGKKQDMGS